MRAWPILLFGLVTACTGGATATSGSPSAPSSVDPSVYAVFQLRPVTGVLRPSSSAWDATPLSCSPESTDAAACTASPDNAGRIVLAGPTGSRERYVLGAAIVDAGDVSGATARLQGTSGEVSVALTPAGSDALTEATRVVASAASPEKIAIIVTGRVLSAPIAHVPIASGQVVVTGLTRSAARQLSLRLNALAA
jgi:hypothetical protein